MRSFTLLALAAGISSALAFGACKRRASSTQTEERARVEERAVKAVDGRCPDVLERTRDGGLDSDRYVVPSEAERSVTDLDHFDYVIVNGPPYVHEGVVGWGRLAPMTSTGRWRLYRVE